MSVDLLVPVVALAEPFDAHDLARARPDAAEALQTWHASVGCRRDTDADHEDFWEGVYRLHAAVNSGADRIWVATRQSTGVATLLHGTESARIADLLERVEDLVVYGTISRATTRQLAARFHVDNIAWYDSPALRTHLRRRIVPCGFMSDRDHPSDVSAVLASLTGARPGRLFAKTTRKSMHTSLDVTGDPETDRDLVFAEFDWEPVRLEDNPRGFLVSDHVDMRFEYRTYLVDGVPVTGAGNVEALTPLDALPGRPFDPRMEEHRGRSPVTADPDLVRRYVDFASRVGTDLAAEGLLPSVLNLDVALGPDDEPLVVEIHSGLINTGLFATDPALFVAEVVAAARRRRGAHVTVPPTRASWSS